MTPDLEKKSTHQGHSPSNQNTVKNPEKINQNRRSLVHKLAVGSAAIACCSVLPEKWSTPLVEFGSLPAHATTSGTINAVIEELEEHLTTEEEAALEEALSDVETQQKSEAETRGYASTHRINNSGMIYIDGILRSKFIYGGYGTDFGRSILIVFSSGVELFVPNTSNDVNSATGKGYRPGGKHPEIPTMEVYADIGDHPGYITIYYNG